MPISVPPVTAPAPQTTAAVGTIDPTAAAPASATAGASTNSMDKDTFMKLLVAQLKYQDPMNPTDSAQFMAQTAQFSSLEKLEQVADQTQQALAAQLAFGASSLVGRTVAYPQEDGSTATGVVDKVSFTSNGPVLTVGGKEVAMNDVTAVTTTGAAATETPAVETGTDAGPTTSTP
ncbi:MAG: flagellar hook capping FlgD N-terminal domain-containing protein [Nocardioidaceae bacterium]|nr:flagellar hook capping FlgD N-terminal domain-containing protein [Nocardioidaceae bacterium]